jgi:pimeloyl-ACP methyl ester carboxylesterase
VLALHGWLDNAGSFDGLAPLLPGVRLVALDLPGHGRSEHRPPQCPYDFIYWVPDVLGAADALGWDQLQIIGHSLGASVGAFVAGTVPRRVRGLVLVDALGPTTTEPPGTPSALASAVARRRKHIGPSKRVHPGVEDAAAVLRTVNPTLTQRAALALAARGTRQVPGGYGWSFDPRLRLPSLLRLTEGHVRAFFKRIRCPALVVRAQNSWLVKSATIDARLECLQTVHLLDAGGGHHLHLVQPRGIASQVGRFLANPGRFSAAKESG